jgi:hypothetical protein
MQVWPPKRDELENNERENLRHHSLHLWTVSAPQLTLVINCGDNQPTEWSVAQTHIGLVGDAVVGCYTLAVG